MRERGGCEEGRGERTAAGYGRQEAGFLEGEG